MTPDPAGWAALLLVHPSPTAGPSLEPLFDAAGYRQLHHATALASVPDLVAALQPDLLVLDLPEPDEAAVSLIETLRATRPARLYLPILVLVQATTPAARRGLLAAGANEFLVHPVEAFELLLRARNLLETRRLHAQLSRDNLALEATVEARIVESRVHHAALAAAADAIVITNRDGRIEWVNQAFTTLTGYTAAEVIGQRPRVLQSGQHPPAFYTQLWRTITSGAVWRGEIVNRYKDGRLATEAMTITPVRDDTGAITHFIAIKQDVTERLERAQVQARLSAIVEASPEFIGTADMDGRVLFLNPAARRLLELPEDLPAGALSIVDCHPPWAAARVFQEGLPAATRDGVWQGETALLSRSGRVIPVEQIILAHMGADGHVAFLSTIARDLSERQRAEAELARQQGLMTQNEKLAAMSTLLAGVAHELNNPLAVVVGRSALLQMKALDPDVVRQVAQIEEAATRCTRIVKNFLAVARQQPPERAACLLDLVVRDALEILSYSLRVDGVDLRLELAGDRHLLQADAHQLQQVVINLVSNAHHAVRGVATRGITLRTQYDDAHGVARLIVEDTGPGITPEVERRLFEPFFTTKPLGQGTGLGLSLCRGIVEDHGGRIRVEGRPGLGARFLIELPVPRTAEPGAGPSASDEPPPAPPCRILVVDDEPSVAHTVAGLLASDGHEADAVTSVASALERLAAQAYAVVFSDVRMPELDGLAFYRLLAHQYPALCARLIFLTGDTLDPTLGTQLRETGRPSIAKPLTRGHLRRAIAQVLAAAS